MKKDALKKANEINAKIIDLSYALECFQWTNPEDETMVLSTDPILVIDFNNGDQRDQISLPLDLSDEFTKIIKLEIQKRIRALETELGKL